MPDLVPNKVSTLDTQPPLNIGASVRRQPTAFRQLGYARSFTSTKEGDNLVPSQRPSYYLLSALDSLRENESVVKQGLEYLEAAVISRIGAYSHPNPQIDAFVQANINLSLKRWIKDALRTSLWSGFSVQEINWKQKVGPNYESQTWIDSLVSFHPLQVTIVPNDYGSLSDGDEVRDKVYKSGVWVTTPPESIIKPPKNTEVVGSLVRLPKTKRVYMAFRAEGSNLYGKPLIQACLPWHLYKQAFTELLFHALSRYASPLIYIKVPQQDTTESIVEPDGVVRPKTMQEKATEMLRDLDNESALVFTQTSKDLPVEIGALTTGNNFADSFNNSIDLADDNMRGILGIPNLIMKDNVGGLGGGTSERQVELFNQIITSMIDFVTQPFLDQVIRPLINYNFDPATVPYANDTGTILTKPPKAELKIVLDGINHLVDKYNLNSNDAERNYVKDLLGFPQ